MMMMMMMMMMMNDLRVDPLFLLLLGLSFPSLILAMDAGGARFETLLAYLSPLHIFFSSLGIV